MSAIQSPTTRVKQPQRRGARVVRSHGPCEGGTLHPPHTLEVMRSALCRVVPHFLDAPPPTHQTEKQNTLCDKRRKWETPA